MSTNTLVVSASRQQAALPDLPITREDEATPFVRSLARALSLNALSPSGLEALAAFNGTVSLVSRSDPQRATISRTSGGIHVQRGVAQDASLTLEVDPTNRRALAGETKPDVDPTSELVLRLINPVLPPWQEMTDSFWYTAKNVRGLPPLLLQDVDTQDRVRLGCDGVPYEIHGSAEALSCFVAGTEFFPLAVFDGRLLIRGSFRGFSSVTGASMKVMFDV